MKKKHVSRLVSASAVGALALGAIALAPSAFSGEDTAFAAEGCGDTTAGMTLGDGWQTKTTVDINQSQAKETTIAEITKIRKDALDTNVKWPTQDSATTMRDYLKSKNITEADYLDVKWSTALERIAIQRAVEAGQVEDGHTRTNGQPWSTLQFEGTQTFAENLAWGSGSIAKAIEQWASEKTDWVNKTGGVTGHYTNIISPDQKSYGVAGTPNAGAYGSTYSMEASGQVLAAQDGTNWVGSCEFTVPFDDTRVSNVTLSAVSVEVGKSAPLVTSADFLARYGDRFKITGTYTSGNEAIATVSGDQITGVAAGDTSVKLTSGSKTVSGTVKVVQAQTPTQTVAPQPTQTVAPQPTQTVAPQPTQTVAPQPTQTVAPQPTQTVAPQPTQTVAPQPTQTVAPQPTQTVAPEPTQTEDGTKLSLSAGNAVAGDTVTVTVNGLNPNEEVAFELHSDPIALGTATADANGTVMFAFTVTEAMSAGQHNVVVQRADGTELSIPLTLTETKVAVPSRSTSAKTQDAAVVTEKQGLATTGAEGFLPLGILSVALLVSAGVVTMIARRNSDKA